MRGLRPAELCLLLCGLGLVACFSACLSACSEAHGLESAARASITASVTASSNALQGPQDDVAALCGFTCAPSGLGDGNAAISAVSSADTFYASVIALQRGESALYAEIDTELAASGADFGISGDLGPEVVAQAAMFLSGELRVRAGHPECLVDASTFLDTLARCDPSLDRATAVMNCAGACDSSGKEGKCPSGSSERCITLAETHCADLCQGSCDNTIKNASCDGECDGTCSGTCLAYDSAGACAGYCSGKCDGRCRTDSFDAAPCDGTCHGHCVDEQSSGDCADALRKQCVVPDTGEPVACAGSCDGNPSSTTGLPECQIGAEVFATVSLSCRAGGASAVYVPAPTPAKAEDAAAQARFLSALHNLLRRLPQLLVLAEQGERMVEASDDLTHAANGVDLSKSFSDESSGDITTRAAVGLECAVGQLPSVETTLGDTTVMLSASLDKITALSQSLGLETL